MSNDGNDLRKKLLGLLLALSLVAIAMFAKFRMTGRGTGGEDTGGGCGGPSDPSAQSVNAATAIENLGELQKPGPTLNGSTHTLRPGGFLIFDVREEATLGILGMDVSDQAGVTVTDEELEPSPANAGSTALHRFTFALSSHVQAGSRIHVATMPTWSARTDPKWAFAFDIAVP